MSTTARHTEPVDAADGTDAAGTDAVETADTADASRPAGQLVLIDGGRTAPRRDWHLDERTRRIGRMGVAQARAILRQTHPPEPPGRQRERRAS